MTASRMPSHLLTRFKRDNSGQMAMIFGALMIPMLGIVGGAIDVGRAVAAKTRLQAAVDASAIAGARLPATANQNRTEAASAVFLANLSGTELGETAPRITASNAEVKVEATYNVPMAALSLFKITEIPVSASSSARSQVQNGGVICLLALNTTTSDGLHLQGINKTSQDNCWAWVNSSHSTSINAVGASSGTAQGYCTVGGVLGGDHFSPAPYAGCDPFADPFAARFSSYSPSSSTCTRNNLQLSAGDHVLEPGVYCGGIDMKPHANVQFKPGNYIIKNGVFKVQAHSRAYGTGVSFYFTGNNADIDVRAGGSMELRAPASGDLAGFLFVQDRTANPGNEIEIQGGGTMKLEGVLYTPTWRVNVGGNSEINQDSQFWAMIADSFYMEGNGKLYVRSNASLVGLPQIMPKIPTGPLLLR